MAISTVLNQTIRQGELRRSILAPQLETNVTKFKGKTFTGNRKLVDIIANAKAQGVAVDDYNFRRLGDDNIAFGNANGKRPDGSPLVSCGVVGPFVLYNTFNGKFFGRTDKGVDFDSSSTVHEAEPWFQQLLEFFYVEKTAAEMFTKEGRVKPAATVKSRKTRSGVVVEARAAKGQDLRDVLPAMSAQGLYQVDSSDGGAY